MNKKGLEVLKSLTQFISVEDFLIVSNTDTGVIDDYYEQIQSFCQLNKISFYNSNAELPKSSFKFAIGWRWLIKDSTNLIVLHDSLLPKYRGFAPLVNSLINGEKEIGVTALYANDNFDSGDIISQSKVSIEYPIKIKDAIIKIIPLYISIISKILLKINSNSELEGVPQKNSLATYSLWRDEEDYFIDWNQDSSNIKRMIDAGGYPYKGAHTYVNEEIAIVKECEVVEDVIIVNRQYGKVIFMETGNPIVVCKSGLLKINFMYNTKGEKINKIKFRSRFK